MKSPQVPGADRTESAHCGAHPMTLKAARHVLVPAGNLYLTIVAVSTVMIAMVVSVMMVMVLMSIDSSLSHTL